MFAEGGTEETRERYEMAMIKYSLRGGERILFCEMYVYIYKKKIQIDTLVLITCYIYIHIAKNCT